jgi:hypothetical protein
MGMCFVACGLFNIVAEAQALEPPLGGCLQRVGSAECAVLIDSKVDYTGTE